LSDIFVGFSLQTIWQSNLLKQPIE